MINQDGGGNLGIEQIVWNNSIPCSQVRLDKLHPDDFLMKNGHPCWTYYRSNLICCPCHHWLELDYGPQDGETCLSMIWHHYIEIGGIWRFKFSRKQKIYKICQEWNTEASVWLPQLRLCAKTLNLKLQARKKKGGINISKYDTVVTRCQVANRHLCNSSS